MTTYSCSSSKSPEDRKDPVERSSTFVQGHWTHHAYHQSYDSKTTVVHKRDGFEVLRGNKRVHYKMNLLAHNPRVFIFNPDNSAVAFWAPLTKKHLAKRIAVLPTKGRLASKFDVEKNIVYTPPLGHMPFGMEWGCDGKALFVIERVDEKGNLYSRIYRIKYPGGQTKLIASKQGMIDFFMPPISRFESGNGPSTKAYKLIYGAEDGLYTVDPDGRNEERISTLPAVGLSNMEWNPKETVNQVCLYFRFPTAGADNRMFKGVYLVNLDKRRDDEEFISNLYTDTDIHTIWYSPKGTYLTYSGKQAIYYQKALEADQPTIVQVYDKDGQTIEIKGFSWNDKETKVVFTAMQSVFVLDRTKMRKLTEEEITNKAVEYKVDELTVRLEIDGEAEALKEREVGEVYRVAHFKGQKTWAAEPKWNGDRIFLTVISDASKELKKIRNTPKSNFDSMLKYKDGSGFQRPDDK